MNFDHHLFRCSSLGHLMSEPMGDTPLDRYMKAKFKYDKLKENPPPEFNKDGSKSKNWFKWEQSCIANGQQVSELFKIKDEVQLSEGAKTHLMDVYISEKYGRKQDIQNKYIEKGLAVEEDGITIYSRNKRIMFTKNETHLKNNFIMGTPDMFIGAAIHDADRIIDIKCSWTIYTYFRTFTKDVNSLYYWQGMGYMWLTGANYFDLAYCLVNTPESLIEAEKRSLWYKLGQPAEDDGNFVDACWELERSMVYDDVPLKEKLLEYTIERNEGDIELLKGKIKAGRDYLNQIHVDLTAKFA